MEIQRAMLCHDAPLCHNLPTCFPSLSPSLSLLHTHNSHFAHPATAMKLALTLERAAAAAADAGRTRQGWGWGGVCGDRREDQPKTNRELLTLSWVIPNRLNLLTHSVVCPPPPKGRLVGVTSASAPKRDWGDEEKGTGKGQSSFTSTSLSPFCPFWHFEGSSLTSPPPLNFPPPHLVLNWQVWLWPNAAWLWPPGQTDGAWTGWAGKHRDLTHRVRIINSERHTFSNTWSSKHVGVCVCVQSPTRAAEPMLPAAAAARKVLPVSRWLLRARTQRRKEKEEKLTNTHVGATTPARTRGQNT